MKRLFLLLCFGVSMQLYSQVPLADIRYTPPTPKRQGYNPLGSTPPPALLPEISYENLASRVKSGWYEATVKYSNPSTQTKSTYALNVKVFNDRVTIISFGDEGSIHTGSNNSNYSYTGGNLIFHSDDYGDVVAITTRIRINKGNSVSYFDVEL